MTWALAVGVVIAILSAPAVEVIRWVRARKTDDAQTKGALATTGLTAAQATLAAEEVEGKKMDRLEKMWVRLEDRDNRIDELETRIDDLSADLDVERHARQKSDRKNLAGLKVTRDYADQLRAMVPPPPPPYPEGWSEIHSLTRLAHPNPTPPARSTPEPWQVQTVQYPNEGA